MKQKTKLDLELIQKLASENKTSTEISIILNVSCSTIFTYCKRNNIKLKKGSIGGKNAINMTGKKYGAITVLSKSEQKPDTPSAKYFSYWNCQCECGKKIIARGSDLRKNRIKTCGCRISIKTKRNWQGSKYVSKTKWSQINRGAENRNIIIDIDLKYLDKLLEKQNFKCAISGLDIDAISIKGTASLDRIDSKKGYIKGNVQWVHKDVNFMKQAYSQEYLIKLCKQIASYNT